MGPQATILRDALQHDFAKFHWREFILCVCGIDPTFPSNVTLIPESVGIPWTRPWIIINRIVQGTVETHERDKEYNERVRTSIKKLYATDHKVDMSKHPQWERECM